ncbi:T-complex protein 1 subunit alpha [Allomyces macrogynus ATCC 38327]|uniref:T-complex protein 1 subunit alpha n=1 Tax=Allomyces macrogynus (strain ATCC 38327) TaxID=578462 RepID=A0A0L0TE13_ALLM3|nr:T-complex protein 1 subunit alpha [Allomyces macrogynus ATCC 38327]|eukprot:KNE72921.1 T-complex protein 1 subunit alpha [Allomyces macrogynus ATCC 38327]
MTGSTTSTQAALPAPPAAAAAAQPHVTPSPALALVLSSDAAFLVDRPVRRSAAQRALLGSMPSPRAVRQVAGWLVGSSSSAATTSSSAAPATATTGRARAGSVDSVASSDEGGNATTAAPAAPGAPAWTVSASAQSFPLVLRFADARDAHRFLESLQTRGAPAPSPIQAGAPDAKKALKAMGLDLIKGETRDNVKAGVLEPAMSKIKSLKAATEAAISILRIDDMIKLMPAQQEGEDPHAGLH